MRLAWLVLLCLVTAPISAGAVHPCDTQPSGPWVLRTGKAPAVAWCQTGSYDGFLVSVDGAVTNIGKPAPAASGVGLFGTYYAVGWPSGVGKGTHTFTVRAYLATGEQGPQGVLVFVR